MTILSTTNSNLIFLGARQANSKTGALLTFVKLGDVEKFENYDFIVDAQKVNINVPINSPINASFEISVYQGRPNFRLVGISAIDKK